MDGSQSSSLRLDPPPTNQLSSTTQTDTKPSLESADSTTSTTKSKPRNNSHSLSSASSVTSLSSRKGRYAEPGTTDTHAERANISMPPPPRPAKSRTSSTYSTRNSNSSAAEVIRQGLLSSRRPSKDDFAVEEEQEDIDTPRIQAMAEDSRLTSNLSETTIGRSRPSISESEGKRMSVSSVYSLQSARAGGGQSSAPTSTNGSDVGTKPRTASGTLSPTKFGVSQPETSTSVVSVTTSSNNQSGLGSTGGPQLAPRETSESSTKSMATTTPQKDDGRPQPPTRDRSRAKRRFSGSTGASSHSPSSERGIISSEAKPAPKWGIIGVCALDVKARSKPCRNILSRVIAKKEFEVTVFGDKVILDEDVENWPVCDFLISFFSDGFPLDKAIAYVKLRKPFCVNDLPMQKVLWDRRSVLLILDKINVPTPKRVEVNRDGGPEILTPDMIKYLNGIAGVNLGELPPSAAPQKVELIDDGDTLSVDGVLLSKPFVEKPVSGEDHNICVYFPKSQGGGARKLFRKIGNKSSEWVEEMNTPRAILEPESSYVYEQYMKVENAEDVKAYTVGSTFCHAETRKSPVVDGLVRRNTHGKEIRYVTALTPDEKSIASRIANSFAQRVCGFDLLRTEDGKSYVIDVNGWSFVKDNDEYYDQSARIMREMFIQEKQKQLGGQPSTSTTPSQSDSSTPIPRAVAKDQAAKDSQHHRSALSTLLSKSPSISKLHGHHHNHKKTNGTASPPASSINPTPRESPSGAIKGLQLPDIPTGPLLPPPALSSATSSAPPTAPTTVPTTPSLVDPEPTEPVVPPPAPKHSWKLKGMVSVIRHADRTPKQKYKFTFHSKPFIELLKGHQEEVLLTGSAALDSVVYAVDQAAREGIEDREKLRTLRNVLAKKGGWAGTKVQIKPMFRKRKPEELQPVEVLAADQVLSAKLPETNPAVPIKLASDDEPTPVGPVRRQDSISDSTLSRITAVENSLVLDKLQLIVKWGGEPTHSARYQAQELGENMRNDLMLMNQDILDEVHVFSSSERRVTTSAQIWASAFTNQKELPADFITVRKDLLDDSNAAKDEMDKVKKKLKTLLRQGSEAPSQFAWPANMPEPSIVQRYVVQLMKFHRKVMRHNFSRLYGGASSSLNAIANPQDKETSHFQAGSAMSQATATSVIQARWCCGEDPELFKERWEKLFAEFCDGDKVDPSKISELYDTMKFDALHNRQFLEWAFTPSASILAEEEEAIIQESKGIEKKKEQPKEQPKDTDNNSTDSRSSIDRNESTKSLHRRMFRRRSVLAPRSPDEIPEQYFRLYTGNSQTKAKTDARLERLRELYQLVKVMFDFICPQEYGITENEKLEIGLLTSLPLLKEIVQDLEEMQASDDAKSFFYFTKESHIYTLLNCILEGGIESKIKRSAIPELDYLSQICFELYESENKAPLETLGVDVPKYTYSIRITISPGCHTFDPLDVQLDSKHCISCAPRRSLTSHGDWKAVIETLRAKFHQVKLPKSFLAVNLSEKHTFHKKDDTDDDLSPKQNTFAAATADASKVDNIPGDITSDQSNGAVPEVTTEAPTPTSATSEADKSEDKNLI